MSDADILIGASVALNVILFLVITKVQGFWATSGMKNLFTQSLLASFNRIRNPKIVVGGNFSRFAPISIVGDNEPIYPDPTNKNGLPLQYEPKNIFRGPKGIPLIFAFQGYLNNVNPLDNTTDDVELGMHAQASMKFIDIEVERKYQNDNPFKSINRNLFILGAVMVLGFIVLGLLLSNIDSTARGIAGIIEKYRPILENIIAHPEQFGLSNIIGTNPTPPPSPPQQIIPGVV